ncbi:MAG: 3'(2'),5'-bisphosphate nucleotidase CysQ [Spirochaetales bacterium]|nr:3'(2'),5'-bisphosphate nucleotidase CysQ [Spirochaetales bacterium]
MDVNVLGDHLVSAVRAALAAGREILEVYGREFTVDTKEDLTPITEADRRAHRVILERLGTDSPYPILSEEGSDVPFAERQRWETYWLVDPLDGTKEFVKRNGEFTVNIALMDREGPLAGVVYGPVLGILYFALRAGGAYRLPRADAAAAAVGPAAPGEEDPREAGFRALLAVAERLPYRGSLELDERRPHPCLTVMASRSHGGPAFESYLAGLRRYALRIEIRPLGSALKPCVIAAGEADIYPRLGRTMEWDTAAAHAVVREVGKRMTALDSGRELVYNKPELVNPSFVVL